MNLNIDFPLILVLACVLTGLISLCDILFWAKKRQLQTTSSPEAKVIRRKAPWPIEYSRSFFPVLLLVLVIRSFIFQPYRVPTGSLEPTVLPGDIIAVNQSAYGLRLPVLNTNIFAINEPKIGDLAVFRWPVDPSINFVKRVIGTPGDHIAYKNKVLYINGKEAKQTLIGTAYDEETNIDFPVLKFEENLNGVTHDILVWPSGGLTKEFDLTVPPGMYFMMGDNRDNSDDSRSWGFVSEDDLIGRPYAVLLSWDNQDNSMRWSRTVKGIH